jgi:hypothetical protein
VAVLLGLMAADTPGAWAWVWLAVPAAVAASTLVAWRFGRWGLLLPLALVAGAAVLGAGGALWSWWIPAAAMTGAWNGLREEGGLDGPGDRAWHLLPVLALAVVVPWLPGFSALQGHLLADVDATRRVFETEGLRSLKGQQLKDAQAGLELSMKMYRDVVVPYLLPVTWFAWVAALVGAGRMFAARGARVLRWPSLERASLTRWRMPDGVLWTFIVGLAVVVLGWKPALSSGWTLLLAAGFGFVVQGIAVVTALLLARGVPSVVITLSMVVIAVLAPVFFVTVAALGLSDVWLDYRRLEPAADGGQP